MSRRCGNWRKRAQVRAAKIDPESDLCELRLRGCTEWAETWDHIVPRNRGGSNRVENLRRTCESCNRKKGGRLDSELPFWLREPRQRSR